MIEIMRFMLGAPRSGAGKTTIALALLSELKQRGASPIAFRCGSDDIDTRLHQAVLGIPCHNTEMSLAGDAVAQNLLREYAQSYSIAVIDGVMGYYDGIGGSTAGSSYHLADITETPVIFVVPVKGTSLSAAAQIKGFSTFRNPSRIAGVIFNDCSERLYTMLREPIEKETGLPVIGYFPRLSDCRIQCVNPGHATASEISDLREKLDRLGAQAQKSINIDLLLKIASDVSKI
jgi:cobyrinic acid a,c-diamide synthase